MKLERRIPGRCYFCGDPVCLVSEWFCIAHLWAEDLGLTDAAVKRKRWLDCLAALR